MIGAMLRICRRFNRHVFKRVIVLPSARTIGLTIEEMMVDSYALTLMGMACIVLCLRTMMVEDSDPTWVNFDYFFCQSSIIMLSVAANLIITIPSRNNRMAYEKSLGVLSEKRGFIRYISHEVRSPLASLTDAIELLMRLMNNQTLTDDFVDLLTDLQFCATSVIDLLNGLLEYERIDAGLSVLDFQFTSVSNIIYEHFKTLDLMARFHDVKFSVHYDPNCENRNIGRLFIDKSKIVNEVIRNLVTNAIKFTPVGGQVSLNFKYENLNSAICESIRSGSCRCDPVVADLV